MLVYACIHICNHSEDINTMTKLATLNVLNKKTFLNKDAKQLFYENCLHEPDISINHVVFA